jgi:hypothetical protein
MRTSVKGAGICRGRRFRASARLTHKARTRPLTGAVVGALRVDPHNITPTILPKKIEELRIRGAICIIWR